MTITAERKAELIAEHGRAEGDTGSPEVQVSILTERIVNLTEHFKTARQGQSFAPRPADAGQQAPLACSPTCSKKDGEPLHRADRRSSACANNNEGRLRNGAPSHIATTVRQRKLAPISANQSRLTDLQPSLG